MTCLIQGGLGAWNLFSPFFSHEKRKKKKEKEDATWDIEPQANISKASFFLEENPASSPRVKWASRVTQPKSAQKRSLTLSSVNGRGGVGVSFFKDSRKNKVGFEKKKKNACSA